MLGEKPGKRHDAELRPKVYLGKTFHLKQPQGRREEYLDSPRAARRTFLVPDSDQEPALPLYILLSATVRRFPFRLTQARGYDHRWRRWFRSSSDKRSDFTKNQRPVCAAETKRVRHRHINFHFSGVICYIIQVTKGILVEDVDGRR